MTLRHIGSNVGSTVEVSEMESLSKGSIIAGDGSGAPQELSVGANDLMLTADSAQTTGLKWASAGATKEIFIQPYTIDTTPTDVGDFTMESLGSAGNAPFKFKVPHDFTSLTSCELIVIPDATETLQWDLDSDYGAVGEAYNTHSEQSLNETKAVTANTIDFLDVSSVLTSISADDYVGLNFQSDTASIYPIGLRFRYS